MKRSPKHAYFILKGASKKCCIMCAKFRLLLQNCIKLNFLPFYLPPFRKRSDSRRFTLHEGVRFTASVYWVNPLIMQQHVPCRGATMSNSTKKTVSYKLVESKATSLKNLVTTYSEETNKDKGDALYELVIKGADKIIDEPRPSHEEGHPFGSDVVDQIQCPYLHKDAVEFQCLEKVAKTKKAEVIAISPEDCLVKCKACIRKKLEDREAQRQKELRTESMKKLAGFVRQFSKVAENGFEVTAFICTCNQFHGNQFIFSRDGETLFCPLVDDELVNIRGHCQQRINPATGQIPCEYLIGMSQVVELDKEFWEKVESAYPQINVDSEVLENMLPDDVPEILKDEVIERRILDSEATVIEGVLVDEDDEPIEEEFDITERGKAYNEETGELEEVKK